MTQQEQREKKKVQEEGSAIFHFVHSDMMKYLITESEERRVRNRQGCGREVEMHEM